MKNKVCPKVEVFRVLSSAELGVTTGGYALDGTNFTKAIIQYPGGNVSVPIRNN